MSKLDVLRKLRGELEALVASGGLSEKQAAPMLALLLAREAQLEQEEAA